MRDLEWRRRRFIEDQRLYVGAARAEGREEGRAEGKAEGKAERDIEIALTMKRKGFDFDTIADLSGLSLTEIERLD